MKKIFTLSLLFVFTVSFSQTFILPSSGVQSTFSGGCPVGTCAGTLLDPGGAGNYQNNIGSIYQTFCPTTPGNCLQVTFTAFNTESGFDYLTIGNGPAQNSAVFTGAPAIATGEIMGTPATPFSYTANNSSGCLTFRFTSDFINRRAGFTASLTCVPCGAALPAGNSDACASSFICSNLGFNDVSNGPGINPTEGCGGTNCVTGENFSNWYNFTASTSGSLTFTLNPNTASDDFDYAVFGPNVACGTLGAPVRCSYAANTGNTGLGSGAVDVSEDVNGNGWTSPMNVVAGQTYMLMVNNWTAGGAGFNILFGGTATLGVLAPTVNSASICVGQSAILTATPASGGGTYVWTPGGATTQTISVSPSSTTSYSVVYTNGGCTSPASALATVMVNSLPTANAGSPNTLTCANPTVTLSGSGGGTYEWTGPGIVSGSNTATPSVNTAGTYSLAVTSAGCTSTLATVAIPQNTAVPVTSAASTGSITCTTNTINLTSTLAGVNYTWTAPGGSSISSGTNSQNAVGQGSGTYTLLAVDPVNGCSVTSTAAANVNNTAPVTTASSTGSITCTTNTINLTSTLAGASYTWTAPGGSSIASGTNSQNAVGQGPGTYTLTIRNAVNGCTSTAVTTANQNTAAPITSASNTGSITCTTNTINLTSTLAGVNYTWTAPGGSSISSGTNSQNAVGQGAGTYTLLIVNPTNGCSVTATTAANTNTVAPVISASSTGSITCTTNTINLTSTLAGANYTWTAPGGSSITSGINSQNAVGQGLGTYTLMVQSATNGCTNTAVTSANQNTTTPTVTMPGTQTITCLSPTVTLVGSAGPSSCTPVWTGGVCGGANTYSASACSSNTYTLTVTNPANGCVNSGTISVVPSSGIPVVTASNNGSITCSNLSVEVAASTTMTPVSYSWTGPGTITGSSTSNGTVTVGGTYQCVVTNTLTGCTSTVTTLVTTNTVVPTTTINVSGVLTCSTTSVTLTANSISSPVTYLWNTGATTQSITLTTAGPSTAIVTDPSSGCTYTATASVTQNTTTPTGLSAGTNQTLTCVSTSVTLNGSITTPTNASVNWTGAVVCGTTSNLTSAACSAGVYTLTATDGSNGCTATSTVEIFANAGAPTATISSTALVLNCNNPIQTVTVTSTPNTDVTYSWNITPLSTTAGGSVASFSNAGTYICTVTNTLSNCSAPVQVVVTTNTAVPTVTISPSQTLTCANPTAIISTTVNPTSGINYTWVGSGIVSGQGTGTIVVNQLGGYGVVVTDNTNGCSATTSVQITSNTSFPVATITVTTSNSIITCQNPTVTLTASVTPNGTYSYTWAPSGNTNVNEPVTNAGVYGVIVLDATTGCTVAAQPYTVTANTTPPSVSASNTVMPCGSPSVVIGASSTGTNVSYSWSGSGIISGGSSATPLVSSAGQYVVTVTDNTNGCTNTGTVNVTTTSVTAAFTANPMSGASPLLVNFTNQTPGVGNIYSWNFADDNNNTSSLTNPDHTYNTTGTYVVTLVVTDASGLCSSTATLSIEVFDNSSIIVPNVFTPNGDGKNDIFKIATTGIKDLNCDIFNRWGTKVSSIAGVNGSWDGSNVNDGTFFYVLTATGFDGKEYKQQGYINVFK